MAVTDYAVSGERSWPDGSPAQYVGLQGRLLTADTDTFANPEANVRQKMSHAGTCSKLRVRVVASSSAGATVVTLLKNGSGISLTVTINAGGTVPRTEEDTTHSVSFSAGDELSWKIELPSGGGSSPTTVSWISAQIAPSDPSNPEVLDYCAGGVRDWTVPFGNLNQYLPPQGELLSGAECSDAETDQSRAGAVSKLRLRVVQHYNATTTVSLMKNGAATALSATFSATGEAYPRTVENTTDSVSFSAGDKLAWRIQFGSAPDGSTTTITYISAKVVLS